MAEPKQANSELNIDKQRLAQVYAKALLGYVPDDQAESMLDELDAIVDELLVQFPDFESVIASPRVPGADKEQIINNVLGGRVSDGLLTFLKVLGRRGRLDCLRDIRRAARDEFNLARGRVRVLVTTAHPLDDAARARIVDQLRTSIGQDVDLECRVDPSVIGGLVVRIGDTVYDSSVSNRLERLKRDALDMTFNQLRDSIDRFAVSG